MKDSGPVKTGTKESKAMFDYADSLANRLGMHTSAALGQVLKFDDAIRKATQSNIGMSSLVIEVVDQE